MDRWWTESGLSERETQFDQKSKDESYGEFQRFFNRLVCMSSVKVVPDPFNTWEKVQGRDDHQMSAGYTKTQSDGVVHCSFDEGDIDDILKAPHHAFKTLFFNREQMSLLMTNDFPFAIFMCDFGSGKYSKYLYSLIIVSIKTHKYF